MRWIRSILSSLTGLQQRTKISSSKETENSISVELTPVPGRIGYFCYDCQPRTWYFANHVSGFLFCDLQYFLGRRLLGKLSLNVVAAVLHLCSVCPVTYEVVQDDGTPRENQFRALASCQSEEFWLTSGWPHIRLVSPLVVVFFSVSLVAVPWVPEVPRSRQPTTLAVAARDWGWGWTEAGWDEPRPRSLTVPARVVALRERGTSGSQGIITEVDAPNSVAPLF